jgi:hypothetical protein
MRIGIRSPDWQEAMVNNSPRIVLWDGPRSEVYEQVIVSYHALVAPIVAAPLVQLIFSVRTHPPYLFSRSNLLY